MCCAITQSAVRELPKVKACPYQALGQKHDISCQTLPQAESAWLNPCSLLPKSAGPSYLRNLAQVFSEEAIIA